MDRRQLFKYLGMAPVVYPLSGLTQDSDYLSLIPVSAGEEEDNIMEKLILLNDKMIPSILAKQEKRKESKNFGGVHDDYDIFTVHNTVNMISTLICSYSSAVSKYYHSQELIIPLENAARFILSIQHTDGTIDLHTTNFHSTPDTAFMVEPLTAVYGIISKQEFRSDTFKERLKEFLLKAGKALIVGGIHTPNHRWVVTMSLARLNNLFPNPDYITRIDEWLTEKIDIDPDGQYAERSTMTYTPLVNRCLITMARLLKRPALFEPVRKNLEMSMYYMHPNGEVVTESSRRQDQYQRGTMSGYYYPYRYMAFQDNSRSFAAMALYMEKAYPQELVSWLLYLLEDPSLLLLLPEPSALPSDYIKEFTYSDLIRIRREDMDATIIARNPSFFSFYKGNAVLQEVRLAAAFFGKGQFDTEKIEKDGDTYILRKSLRGVYYQPYPKELLPGDGDWNKMPRSNRPESEIQELLYEVRIKEKDSGFELSFNISGTDKVPVALELAFRKGGTLSGVRTIDHTPDTYLLEKGMGQYQYDNQSITFGTGIAEHSWTVLRGALPKSNAMSVYLTGFTPFKKIIEIK
jgi:hypothetical protein